MSNSHFLKQINEQQKTLKDLIKYLDEKNISKQKLDLDTELKQLYAFKQSTKNI